MQVYYVLDKDLEEAIKESIITPIITYFFKNMD